MRPGGARITTDRRRRFVCLIVLPLVVWMLRAAPFVATQLPTADAGTAILPLGYNPRDLLSYVAFQRQLSEQGHWRWVNPFTTEEQDGRFFFLFHAALGAISAVTGLDPFWTLELSRLPLVFVFFWVVWGLAGRLFDRGRDRSWATWLIGLSGGLDWIARGLTSSLPAAAADLVQQDLWHLQGWSTFAALYNPLWIAGLVLTLFALEPILRPGGGRDARSVVRAGLGLFLAWWTHPYSGIVVGAVFAWRVALGLLFRERDVKSRFAGVGAAVAVAGAAIAAIALWQAGDRVFRESSGGVFGSQYLSAFWYPVTLGLLGPFALAGLRRRIEARDRWYPELAAWLIAVIFLHNSPVLNGYHFVFQLHLPVCLLAAPVVADAWDRAHASGRGALALGLFASSLAVTVESVQDVRLQHAVPEAALRLLEMLETLPPGNVLAPAGIGNLIPAFTSHRVYVGQWFLTPDYDERDARYRDLVARPGRERELHEWMSTERVDVLVAPAARETALAEALGSSWRRVGLAGGFVVLIHEEQGA